MGAVWEADGGLRVNRALVVPAGELRWRFSRSSGPGGQGVNTTDSRVELLLDVASSSVFDENQRARVLDRLAARLVDGVLTVTASEHRSQLRNRDAAALRLALLLRDALAPPGRARRPTRPTRGSQQRRLDAKTRRGATKRLRRPPVD
jgi:ribosome-associated protein